MHKPRDMPLKRFTERLTGIKNLLPLFPGSDESEKMTPEELNEILLHAVPKRWAKKS